MSKATEDDLSNLHGAVCRGLATALEGTVIAVPDAEPVKVPAPAAYFMAAITMLKNNNVTADAEGNEALNDLQKRLSEKRKESKGRLTREGLDAAAETFERDLGGMMQ